MNIEIIPVTFFRQNCSLVWDDNKSAVAIDPGGDSQKLIRRIEELGLDLKLILLTHGHLDHVGAAPQLKQYFDVKVWGSNQANQYWFEALPEQSKKFGLFEIPAFLPDRWLNENGEKIRIGELEFEVLQLPGHTPGHVGFIDHKNKVAFTGDVLFKQCIGRTDFIGGDHQTLLNSIKERMYVLPDDTIVIAGHGSYTTIGQEKRTNPFVKVES